MTVNLVLRQTCTSDHPKSATVQTANAHAKLVVEHVFPGAGCCEPGPTGQWRAEHRASGGSGEDGT